MIMKTIEEKALAYDKALEKVRYLYKHLNNEGTVIYPFELENIFPELKEGEDERIRKNCIHFLELQKQHHTSTFEIEECIAWLEKQGMQKQILANSAKTCKIEPAEWSEEDEEELNKIIAHFDWTGNNRFTKDDCEWAQYWLKSLKDRVVPKQEWSEDDEKAIKDLIDIVEAYYSLRIYKTREKELLDWLKSLKPQSHWKPSDEQMKAFHIALRLTEGETYRTALSLYDDLKKLVQWHEER